MARRTRQAGRSVLPLVWTALAAFGAGADEPSPAPARVVGFRNDGSGVFAETDPPLEWSITKNVMWAAEMPDGSNASPIIVGDRLRLQSRLQSRCKGIGDLSRCNGIGDLVLVMAAPMTLICLDKATGRTLRQRTSHARPGAPGEETAHAVEQWALQRYRLARLQSELNLRHWRHRLGQLEGEVRLARGSDPAAAQALLDELLERCAVRLRRLAAEPIGLVRDILPLVLPALHAALAKDSRASADAARRAIWALARAGEADGGTAAALASALGDADRSVRATAAEALGRMGPAAAGAAAALREAAKSADSRLARAAQYALGRIAPPG